MSTYYEVQMYDSMYGTWYTFTDAITDRKDWAISRTRSARNKFKGSKIRLVEITKRTIPVPAKKKT